MEKVMVQDAGRYLKVVSDLRWDVAPSVLKTMVLKEGSAFEHVTSGTLQKYARTLASLLLFSKRQTSPREKRRVASEDGHLLSGLHSMYEKRP